MKRRIEEEEAGENKNKKTTFNGGGHKIYNFASSRAVSARPSGKGKLEARYSVGKRSRCDSVEWAVRVSSRGKTQKFDVLGYFSTEELQFEFCQCLGGCVSIVFLS